MTTAATQERRRFADLLDEIGPDAPTLCGDWTTRDLAAHIVIRDRRPDAMPGILSSKFAGYTDKVQAQLTKSDEYSEIVTKVREGAPFWSPTRIDAVDRTTNTAEFFVHLEDIRRAQPKWKPRELDVELTKDLYAVLKRGAKMMARKAPAGITLAPTGHASLVANDQEPMVVVSGPVGELVLWLYGRQAHSQVSYDGPADAVEALRTASFGI
ncbi:MAG TPA: TIGR03085 family metal-binding protein [Ilumatobacter sp.]|nr:TIGR03085 family metal-binding protein [Ilumatobacter sp.]